MSNGEAAPTWCIAKPSAEVEKLHPQDWLQLRPNWNRLQSFSWVVIASIRTMLFRMVQLPCRKELLGLPCQWHWLNRLSEPICWHLPPSSLRTHEGSYPSSAVLQFRQNLISMSKLCFSLNWTKQLLSTSLTEPTLLKYVCCKTFQSLIICFVKHNSNHRFRFLQKLITTRIES